MNFGVAIHSDEDPGRRRLFVSLAGALLIASLGFALIFYSFAWLPYHTLTWLDTLPPARATRILRMITLFTRAFALVFGASAAALLLAFVARKQRSKQKHPITLPRKRVTTL
jgi:hypothetical protein